MSALLADCLGAISSRTGQPATTGWSASVRRGDDRAFEALYERYQRRIHAYVFGHGQGPPARRGRHAGGLRLRAAAHARHRAPDRVQALGLRDRQERVHRPVPPLQARGGGLLQRRRRASRPPTTARLVAAPSRCPSRAGRQAAARPPVRRVRRPVGGPPRDPRAARARGPLLPRDRRAHGHEPPGRREHPLPRPPPPDRGVRRARLRPALPAHPVDHRRRRRAAASARATRAASRATSPTASRAAARRSPPASSTRPPSPAARCATARSRRSPRCSRSRCCFRGRRGGGATRGSASCRCVSDHAAAGGAKLAAVAALVVAGLGAGVGTQVGSAGDDSGQTARPAKSETRKTVASSSGAPADDRAGRDGPQDIAEKAAAKRPAARIRSEKRQQGRLGHARARPRRPPAAAARPRRPPRPPRGSSGVKAPAQAAQAGQGRHLRRRPTPKVPKLELPRVPLPSGDSVHADASIPPATVGGVVDGVDQARPAGPAEASKGAVNETVPQVTEPRANDVLGGLGGLAPRVL